MSIPLTEERPFFYNMFPRFLFAKRIQPRPISEEHIYIFDNVAYNSYHPLRFKENAYSRHFLNLHHLNNYDVALLAHPLSQNKLLEEIDLTYEAHTCAQARVIAKTLQHAPETLTIFSLHADEIDTLIPLADAFKKKQTLKKLEILHLQIRNPSPTTLPVAKEIDALAQAIENMEKLSVLKLDGIALDDHGAKRLAIALVHPNAASLTSFQLEDMHHMSLAGMIVLARAIARHPNITFFSFTSHQITASQANEMLDILKKNTNLTYINIRYADQKTEGDRDIVYSRQHDITLRNQELAKGMVKTTPTPDISPPQKEKPPIALTQTTVSPIQPSISPITKQSSTPAPTSEPQASHTFQVHQILSVLIATSLWLSACLTRLQQIAMLFATPFASKDAAQKNEHELERVAPISAPPTLDRPIVS